jgi:phenylalanyl-tRNA synthetase alpha chain
MLSQLDALRREAEEEVASASSLQALAEVEIRYLGRKGALTQLLRSLGSLPPEERPAAGRSVNDAKEAIQAAVNARRAHLSRKELASRLEQETLDVTLPGRAPRSGTFHPINSTIDRVRQVMVGLGFEFVESPDVELYRYNFEALNYPPDHPAMDEQMSFYVSDGVLLRTQTTSAQGRVMPHRKPPFRIAVVGRCYRYETVDATHNHTFYQVDGFMVDRGVTMAHLKGTMEAINKALFGPDVRTRFRPDYFPFVEPGAETAISCVFCSGKGCRICKDSGWLEQGGSGLIHPNVLRGCGIDPEEWSGYAFGWGIERLPMLLYGIDDIRLFYDNDIRFLQQF